MSPAAAPGEAGSSRDRRGLAAVAPRSGRRGNPTRRVGAGLALLATLLAGSAQAEAERVGDARLVPLSFSDLKGWAEDDHAAAWGPFRRSCEAVLRDEPALRPASPADAPLRAVCQRAATLSATPTGSEARTFFERNFQAFEVVPPRGRGFLTGYFETVYPGSLEPSERFPAPLLARPDDLITIPQGETLPGLAAGLQAARRRGDGYEPYPDRAAIETGALGGLARPLVYLGEPEAFIIHVQGSARIRLPDGRSVRVAYAGRNGQPYTSIGKILVDTGEVPLAEMNLERLVGWLREHPEEGRRLMRRNRSYIFFRTADELDEADGPIGGAGLPLTPGRSLAIDRSLWSYGLPVWLEGELPLAGGTTEPLGRLMIAQDTGSAIVGPARGDFYFGSGPEAGTRAGLLRHPVRFVVLRPRPDPAPDRPSPG